MDSAPAATDDIRIITLIRGVMQQGGFYWCYVAVKPSLMRKFQQAVKNKYNIQNFVKDEYGEVIVSGRGKQPPVEITKQVSEMFEVTFEQIDAGIAEVSIDRILSAMEEAKK